MEPVSLYLARIFDTHPWLTLNQRDWEYISRDPTSGDFVAFLTEGPMQDNTVARPQSTRVQIPLSPLY
jgi:hypothetical protein